MILISMGSHSIITRFPSANCGEEQGIMVFNPSLPFAWEYPAWIALEAWNISYFYGRRKEN